MLKSKAEKKDKTVTLTEEQFRDASMDAITKMIDKRKDTGDVSDAAMLLLIGGVIAGNIGEELFHKKESEEK